MHLPRVFDSCLPVGVASLWRGAMATTVFFLFAQALVSQSVAFSGRLVDAHDGAELPFATVELMNGAHRVAVVADQTGRFAIVALPIGTYSLTAHHIGCAERVFSVAVARDTFVVIELEHHAALLQEIVVSEKKARTAPTEVGQSLNAAQLEKLRGLSLGQTLSELAGVRVLQTGPTIFKPIIHGLHSSRIAILQNGIRLEGQDWGTDHAPELDAFGIENLTVIKGASTVRYGMGAIGGVVLATPNPPDTAIGWRGAFNLVGATNGRTAAAALKLTHRPRWLPTLALRGQGAYKRGGDLHAPHYQLTNTGMEEASAAAAAVFVPSAHFAAEAQYNFFYTTLGILRAAHIGNLTDLEAALQSKQPLYIEPFSYQIENPKQVVRHHTGAMKLLWNNRTWGSWEARYAVQHNHRQEYDVRRGGRSDVPALDMGLWTHFAEITLAHRPLAPNQTGTFGLQTTFQQNRNDPATGVRPLVPWYNSSHGAIYWWERWWQARWVWEAGVRYEGRWLAAKYFDRSDQLQHDRRWFDGFHANLGATFHYSEKLKLVSNAAYGFRMPNISELYSDGLHHAVAAIEVGNPQLRTERSLKLVQAVEWMPRRWHLVAEWYAQTIDDFIYLYPLAEPALTIRGAFPVFEYAQTDARLWGMDYSVRREMGTNAKWFASAKGAFVRAAQPDGTFLIGFPADYHAIGLDYVLTGYHRWQDFQLSANFEYTARQTRLPADADYTPAPQPYGLLQLSANARLPLNKTLWQIGISADNVLNVSYRSYLNRLRYYADETGRSITLRLRCEW